MVSETFAMKAKAKAEQARYADLIAEERDPFSSFFRIRFRGPVGVCQPCRQTAINFGFRASF